MSEIVVEITIVVRCCLQYSFFVTRYRDAFRLKPAQMAAFCALHVFVNKNNTKTMQLTPFFVCLSCSQRNDQPTKTRIAKCEAENETRA